MLGGFIVLVSEHKTELVAQVLTLIISIMISASIVMYYQYRQLPTAPVLDISQCDPLPPNVRFKRIEQSMFEFEKRLTKIEQNAVMISTYTVVAKPEKIEKRVKKSR